MSGGSPRGKAAKNTSPSKNAPIGLNSLSKTFNILKIIGQGNFGRVFKLENKFDRRLFALKQILITPREDLRKVLQEVENLSRAGTHTNIVRYLDCFLIQEELAMSDLVYSLHSLYLKYSSSFPIILGSSMSNLHAAL